MTTTAATKEIRSRFEAAFLDLLRTQVHLDYQRDRRITGYFLEFRRVTPEGLFLSYNFLRVKLDYSLCFAVLLAPHNSAPHLLSPLAFGTRFDNNRTLWRQYLDDLHLQRGDPGYPPYLWSSGTPRSNTLEIIGRAIDAPERQLYPHYREVIRQGKHRLITLIRHAATLLERIAALDLRPDTDLPGVAAALGIDPQALAYFGPLLGNAIAGPQIARGGIHWVGFGPAHNTVDLDSVPLDILVLQNLPAFQTSEVPLESVAQRLEAL